MFTKWNRICIALTVFTMILITAVYAGEDSRKKIKPFISRVQAQNIAVQKVPGGRAVELAFTDHLFNDSEYEVTVVTDSDLFIVSIDAETGQISKMDQSPIYEDKLSRTENARISGNNYITPEHARTIAMGRAGTAHIVGMDREMDGDRLVYGVEMIGHESQIDMKIDGVTGNVFSYEEEKL